MLYPPPTGKTFEFRPSFLLLLLSADDDNFDFVLEEASGGAGWGGDTKEVCFGVPNPFAGTELLKLAMG